MYPHQQPPESNSMYHAFHSSNNPRTQSPAVGGNPHHPPQIADVHQPGNYSIQGMIHPQQHGQQLHLAQSHGQFHPHSPQPMYPHSPPPLPPPQQSHPGQSVSPMLNHHSYHPPPPPPPLVSQKKQQENNPSQPAPKGKRDQVANACEHCRTHKVKCDYNEICNSCVAKKLTKCVRNSSRPTYTLDGAVVKIEELEAKKEELEMTVKHLKATVEKQEAELQHYRAREAQHRISAEGVRTSSRPVPDWTQAATGFGGDAGLGMGIGGAAGWEAQGHSMQFVDAGGQENHRGQAAWQGSPGGQA